MSSMLTLSLNLLTTVIRHYLQLTLTSFAIYPSRSTTFVAWGVSISFIFSFDIFVMSLPSPIPSLTLKCTHYSISLYSSQYIIHTLYACIIFLPIHSSISPFIPNSGKSSPIFFTIHVSTIFAYDSHISNLFSLENE